MHDLTIDVPPTYHAFFFMKDIHDRLFYLNYRNSDVTMTQLVEKDTVTSTK